MTGDTSGGRVLKRQRLVACSAGRDLVRTAQGKGRRLMIEYNGRPPFFRMAGFALVALLSFVLVVLLVTSVAVGLQGVFVEMACMATLAGGEEMSASQWIFREAVVVE